jgi:hypothetical protein
MRVAKRSNDLTISLLVLSVVALACTREIPTEATSSSNVVFSKGGSSNLSYTTADLGVLPGDNSSRANAVNDAGLAVGYSAGAETHAFALLNGVMTALPGNRSNALAISNGSTAYVVGWAVDISLPPDNQSSRPAFWTIAAGAASGPTYLDLGGATFGAALGVNDAGAAVGHASNRAAMWDAAGILTLIDAPAGFTRGEGRDINNDGVGVFVFSRTDAGWPNGIAAGYLRLASGDLVLLAPVGTDVVSYANGISESTDNVVHIAGSTYESPSTPKAVRWTVNAITGAILNTEVRPEHSHATAISDARDAAGFLEGAPNSLKSTAFVWRGIDLLSLKPPKRTKDGKAWGMSSSGEFVAGEAIANLSRRAILWRFPPQ